MSSERERRIAAARRALAERYAADPAGVERFEARMARLADIKRRERERVDHLVLEKPRPRLASGKRLRKGKQPVVRFSGGVERAVAQREAWSHKQGTPETHEHAARHDDCLTQMERNGSITKDQREWAAEIANVARSIHSDVSISVASLEARVDNQRGDRNHVAESVRRVRLHFAYTRWREMLPSPRQMVLDMIVGDAIGYTEAARHYRTHHRRAKRVLIEALDRWPDCVAHAYRSVAKSDVERAHCTRSVVVVPD